MFEFLKACSQGRLLSCGCDPSVNRKSLSKHLRENTNIRSAFILEAPPNEILNSTIQKKLSR